MITIGNRHFEISFNNKSDYAIYHIDYPADIDGNVLDEKKDAEIIKQRKFYNYGNIIILTPLAKYSFNKVWHADYWAYLLLNYINAHRDEEDIFINMDRLYFDEDEDMFLFFFCDVTAESPLK